MQLFLTFGNSLSNMLTRRDIISAVIVCTVVHFSYSKVMDMDDDITALRTQITQLRVLTEAMDERIKFERQNSYSSYEDLREQFSAKSIGLVRIINDLETKKKKK